MTTGKKRKKKNYNIMAAKYPIKLNCRIATPRYTSTILNYTWLVNKRSIKYGLSSCRAYVCDMYRYIYNFHGEKVHWHYNEFIADKNDFHIVLHQSSNPINEVRLKIKENFKEYDKIFGAEQSKFTRAVDLDGKEFILVKPDKFWMNSFPALSLFLLLLRADYNGHMSDGQPLIDRAIKHKDALIEYNKGENLWSCEKTKEVGYNGYFYGNGIGSFLQERNLL